MNFSWIGIECLKSYVCYQYIFKLTDARIYLYKINITVSLICCITVYWNNMVLCKLITKFSQSMTTQYNNLHRVFLCVWIILKTCSGGHFIWDFFLLDYSWKICMEPCLFSFCLHGLSCLILNCFYLISPVYLSLVCPYSPDLDVLIHVVDCIRPVSFDTVFKRT